MAYTATWGEGRERLAQAALRFQRSSVPPALVEYLLGLDEVDAAVRWSLGAHPPELVVLLAASVDPLPAGDTTRAGIAAGHRPVDRAEHDRIVSAVETRHLGPDELGGAANGIELVSGFRMFPVVERFAPLATAFGWRAHYQANLRRTRRDPELERALRKRAVRLSEASSLPEPVRQHQTALIDRALAHRWWIDEAVALDDASAAAHLTRMCDEELSAASGHVGFQSLAVTECDRSSLFTMGLHFSRGGWPSIAAASGCAVDRDLTRRVLAWDPRLGTRVAKQSGLRLPGHARVFVSYAQSDVELAERIVGELEEHGTRCWIAPRDIDAGRPYPEAIVAAIEQASLMVVVLSEAAQRSPHVLREIERAVSKRVAILPVRTEPVHLTKEMEYFVSIPQWLDATTQPLEAVLASLGDRVRRELGPAEI